MSDFFNDQAAHHAAAMREALPGYMSPADLHVLLDYVAEIRIAGVEEHLPRLRADIEGYASRADAVENDRYLLLVATIKDLAYRANEVSPPSCRFVNWARLRKLALLCS